MLNLGFAGSSFANHTTGTGVTAKAGPDQIIYLAPTSTGMLDGSGSFGTSYLWTDISTHYKSGARITSPKSAITTVTGSIRCREGL